MSLRGMYSNANTETGFTLKWGYKICSLVTTG